MARRPSPALDLRSADEGLDLLQRRAFDAELPRRCRSAAFASVDLSGLSADERGQGQAAFAQRTLDEYRSQVGLTEFLQEVTELGCAFDILTAAVRVVRDEARHVELCRRMVVALGGSDVIPGTPTWVTSDRSRPVLERVLVSTFGSLCIGETFSMRLLVASRDAATFPLAKAVLTVLAKDESTHSALGWRLLPVLWPVAGKAMRKRVAALLPDLLLASHEAVFGEATHDEAGVEGDPFGDVTLAERQRVWDRTLEKDLVRRFEALGIPSRKAARVLDAKPRFA